MATSHPQNPMTHEDNWPRNNKPSNEPPMESRDPQQRVTHGNKTNMEEEYEEESIWEEKGERREVNLV